MIGFHEERFPEDVSWGSEGGPVYKTQVFQSYRGYEKRNVDWSQPMMEFNVAYGIRTDDQIVRVINFFNARQGMQFGFRYKNWCNFRITDAPIATGDGFSKRLPMFKFYGFPPNRHYKRLKKIVRGSVRGVQAGAEPLTEGVDFIIDYDSGEIVLNFAIGYGVPIYAQNLEFDEPVRFDVDGLQSIIDAYNNSNLNNLPLVSIRGTFTAGSVFSPDNSERGTEDPYFGRTFLIMNFDDVGDPTTTIDQSVIQSPVEMSGTARLTQTAYRHGSGSLSLGATGLVTIGGSPYDLSTTPFTIEFFARRPTEGALVQPIIGRWTPAQGKSYLLRYRMATQRLELVVSSDGLSNERVVLSHPWESYPGNFDYVSVDRLASGWFVLRVNGVVKQTTRDLLPIHIGTSPLTIGNYLGLQANEGPFQGLIDSMRITVGQVRHDSFDKVAIPNTYATA